MDATEYSKCVFKNNSKKFRSWTRPHTNTDISLPAYSQSWWQVVSGLGNNAFPPTLYERVVLPNQTANITSGDIPPNIPPIDGWLNYRYSVLRFYIFITPWRRRSQLQVSEEKEERTMDRSGSVTEMQVILQIFPWEK